MKQIIIFFTLAVCYILQTSFFAAMPLPLVPDLILTFLVFLVLKKGKQAWKWGFIAGLFLDLASGKYLGLAILVFTLVTYLVGIARVYFYEGNPLMPPLLILAATFLKHFLWLVAMFILGAKALPFASFLLLVVEEGIYNIMFYFIFSFLFNRLKLKFTTTDGIL